MNSLNRDLPGRDQTYEGDGGDSQSQINLEELDNQYESRGRASTPTGEGRAASELNASFQPLLDTKHKKLRSDKVLPFGPENADMNMKIVASEIFDKDIPSVVSDGKKVATTALEDGKKVANTDQNQQT